MNKQACSQSRPLPSWFRQDLPDVASLDSMRRLLRQTGLNTVCQGAHCPNLGQCWSRGTATFMILGDTCTRACRFCAVQSGRPGNVNAEEPLKVAEAVAALKLRYVVVTSVTRDDLADQGAGQFADTIKAVRAACPQTRIEVLIPDFGGQTDLLRIVADAQPDVLGHNLETVRRLSPDFRPQANHDRSLSVLKTAREFLDKRETRDGGRGTKSFASIVHRPSSFVKSGFMAGLGETDDEIFETFDELKAAGCDIVTVGQYLAPSQGGRHAAVARFVEPEKFELYRREGLARGLKFVASGPLVRSSYLAENGYQECLRATEG